MSDEFDFKKDPIYGRINEEVLLTLNKVIGEPKKDNPEMEYKEDDFGRMSFS